MIRIGFGVYYAIMGNKDFPKPYSIKAKVAGATQGPFNRALMVLPTSRNMQSEGRPHSILRSPQRAVILRRLTVGKPWTLEAAMGH